MNFIVAQILLHCSETLTFWMFVELIESCELRDIFQDGLPGLIKHAHIINILVEKHLPDLFEHFEELQVRPEDYARDWIFSVFTSILPEDDSTITSAFFEKFFKYKWEFFYKLVLTILSHLEDKLLEQEDMCSCLMMIKVAMSNKNDPYNYAGVH